MLKRLKEEVDYLFLKHGSVLGVISGVLVALLIEIVRIAFIFIIVMIMAKLIGIL